MNKDKRWTAASHRIHLGRQISSKPLLVVRMAHGPHGLHAWVTGWHIIGWGSAAGAAGLRMVRAWCMGCRISLWRISVGKRVPRRQRALTRKMRTLRLVHGWQGGTATHHMVRACA